MVKYSIQMWTKSLLPFLFLIHLQLLGFLLLIVDTRLTHALQRQVHDLPTETSSIFSIGGKQTKYVVSIQNTAPEDQNLPSSTTILPITSKDGSRYKCILPKPPSSSSSQDTSLIESDISMQDEIIPLDQSTPEQLLEALKNVCAYRIEDWWTYEVCYNKQVKQYHSEGKKMTQQHNLGEYKAPTGDEDSLNKVHIDRAASVSSSGGSGEQRYVAQQYTNGDLCELTGEKRSSEVRFTCDPASNSDTVITSITEPHSCHYIITIATYRLCKHPEFKQHPAPVAAVTCYLLTPPPSRQGDGDGAGDGGEGGSCVSEDGNTNNDESGGQCNSNNNSNNAPKQEEKGESNNENHQRQLPLLSSFNQQQTEFEVTASLKEALANLGEADLELTNEEEEGGGGEYEYTYVEYGDTKNKDDEYGTDTGTGDDRTQINNNNEPEGE